MIICGWLTLVVTKTYYVVIKIVINDQRIT